jgi:hypothetical protein
MFALRHTTRSIILKTALDLGHAIDARVSGAGNRHSERGNGGQARVDLHIHIDGGGVEVEERRRKRHGWAVSKLVRILYYF